jgi:uncharacterized repeat protein (TIGR02543 family)
MSKQRFLINSLVIISMVLSLLGVPLLAAPKPAQAATAIPAVVQPAAAAVPVASPLADPICSTIVLTATADTHMRSGNTRQTFNYGASTHVRVNPYYQAGSTDGQLTGALLKWDVTSIPITATISAISVTVYVTETSAYTFSLYSMRRDWVEGTNNGAAGTGASWISATIASTWAISGAQSTTSDRYDTNLWNATTSSFNTLGSVTIPLNSSGVSAVQGWVAGTTNNYGLTIQNYSGTSTDLWGFASREVATVANRPKLNVTYCVETGPVITTSGTLTAFSAPIGTPSAEQSYSVAGTNLTANIVITAPTDFEISTTSGSGFTSTLTLTQTGGTVASTPIYVRFNRSTAGTSSGNITHTSTGATTKNVAVSGTASIYYTLTANASSGGSVALNPSGGSYVSGTVVTLTATANSGYIFTGWSGNLTGSTNPITITMDGNKTVAAAFVAGTCSTANLTATEDTYVSANDVLYNNGGNTFIHVDATTGTSRRAALLRWDVSSIPSNAIVSSATISVNVTDASPLVFNLYNMRRDWVEGTVTQTNSSTSANWNTYDGVNGWGTVGISNTTSDRYDTNLWGAGTTSFSTTGSKAVALNTDGVTVVQGWINGSLSNYGLTMQNYYGSTSNAVFFSSSETATAANRPKLNVTYCAISGPNITINGTLSAFSTTPGEPSATQTYTVSGSSLTDDLYISAPANFEISTDSTASAVLPDSPDGIWSSNLLLYQTDGVVEPAAINVRLHSETEGTFTGNITHTSTGAAEVDVPVSGSALPMYTLTVGTDGNGTVTLNPSGGSYSSGTTVTLTPMPNSGYVFSSWGGANDGDIVNTNGVYTIVMNDDKSLTANFVTATCSTVNLTAAEDTYLSANDVTFNNGGSMQFHVDATTGTSRRTTLLKWNVSSIPTNTTVTSATLSLYVEDASPLAFNLYNMRRDWVEGTVTRTASSTSANWNTYDGANSWGLAGVISTTLDRYDTNLWSAGTSSFSSTGSKTESLNAAGRAVVQGWINGSLGNYGLTMQNYYGSTSNAVFFSSSENGTVANRPKLNVTYCTATTGPTINTTSSLSDFSSNIGVPSAEQSYTVAGSNLTNDIVITAPADFQISKISGSGFGSTVTLTQTGGTVPSTTIYVRFLRATAGTSNGNITHVSPGATQVNVPVSGTALNGAPTISLVQPANGATGVSTSPTLEVTVTDPDADASSVSFYGRPVGTGSGEDFTLVLIPDAQNESQYAPAMFISQTTWIVNNKTAKNIAFVTTAGDMVNTSSDTAQYVNADSAIDVLDAGGVWYSVAPGNHDTAYGTTYYANYFGISRYADRQVSDGYWFGDSPAPYDDYNTYSLFSASGMDFILINLQYSPSSSVLTWADNLLTTYNNRRAIVEEHDILNTDGSWNNQASYNALRDHDNLFLMLCGHMHSSGDGAAYLAGTGTGGAGQTIHIVQADYQDMSYGNGYLRILRFSPSDNMIHMNTYSPYANAYITSTSNYDTADLAYTMASSEPYALIGTVSGVASGSNASVTWPGRTTNQAYEWYAVANDGTTSTTSATWNFTTTNTAGYTLTVNKVGNGTVTKDPNKSTYTSGEVVTLTATPDTGYVFDGWSGALSGSINPTTITMDADKVVTATFLAEVTRTLSSGWNLLALPLQPVTTTLTAQSLLDSLNAQSTTGNCTEVDQWGLTGWVGYLDGMGFDDFAVTPGQGYFVACTTVFDWTLRGHSIQSSVPVTLAVGWNLVGVPYPTTYMAQSLLDAIAADGGSCTEVDQWGLSGWVGYLDGMGFDEFGIAPDQGYFANCTTSSTFTP